MLNVMVLWRLVATAFAFLLFGVVGLFVGLLICPLIFLLPISMTNKGIITRELVSLFFRSFIYILKYLGILTFHLYGFERISNKKNILLVANHPTLIDAVFIIGFARRLNCIVKWGVWCNPCMYFVAKSAGYLHNKLSATELMDKCTLSLDRGDGLIVFPEGTRTVVGKNMRLRRGAAQIALQAGIDITPIRINCSPLFLSKQHTWHYVPDMKPHIEMTVCDDIMVKPYQGEQRSIAVRKITDLIKNSFAEGVTHCG